MVPIMWARIFIFNQSKSFRLNVVSFAFSFPEAMHWLYIKTFRPAILTNQIDSNLTVLSFHIKYEANLWWLLLTSRCWLVEFIEMKRSCDCLNNIVFCSNRDQQFLPIRSIARNIWLFYWVIKHILDNWLLFHGDKANFAFIAAALSLQ